VGGMTMEMISLGIACFALGFAVCNAMWLMRL